MFYQVLALAQEEGRAPAPAPETEPPDCPPPRSRRFPMHQAPGPGRLVLTLSLMERGRQAA